MNPTKIIWIVIDSLRADHLGCYGYNRNTSPFIDSLAKASMQFNFAFSTISYTVPSVTSMFTSKYPSSHSAKFQQKFPEVDKDKEILLAEVLRSMDYKTAAFVGGVVLRKGIGIDTGFDLYDDKMTSCETNRPYELIRSGAETNEGVFKWLKQVGSSPFFLFIHYFDVHGPYVNPEPYDSIFKVEDYGEAQFLDRVVDGEKGGIPDYQLLKVVKNKKGEAIEYERDARYYFAQYDCGIRYFDHILEKLLSELKKMRFYDDALIIVTADHGEAMGEHDVWFFHSLTVTPDQIHVPLIIKMPKKWGIPIRPIDTHVSLIDLMPTILDLMDFNYTGFGLQGKSLVKLISKGEDKGLSMRTITAEIEGQMALIDRQTFKIKPKEVDPLKLTFYYVRELCQKEAVFNYRQGADVFLEWTGERYLPTLESSEISYAHWHRYLFAKELVRGKVVLDIACGEGYGSYLLASNAKSVIGVDIDENTIEYASMKYIKNNLSFKIGKIEDVPIKGEKKFDVIVSFETLEHVDVNKQKKLLNEVKRLIKRNGIFLVSTPEKSVLYGEEPNYNNEFHLKEFYFNEFYDFLSHYFKHIILLGQKIYPVSYIWNITNPSDKYFEFLIKHNSLGFKPTRDADKRPLYILAACSDEEIIDVPASISIDITERLIKERLKLIEEKDREINKMKMIEQEIQSIYSSRTWKVGRFATAPWRWIKKYMVNRNVRHTT